jgi:acyl carrier protein
MDGKMTQQDEQKLSDVFRAVMNLQAGSDVSDLRQLSTPGWDSMAHVSLIAAVESEFAVTIDIEDSLDLTSYQAVKLYLEERVV